MSDFHAAINADFGSVAELVHLHALAAPNSPALSESNSTHTLTYGELDALMNRVAASLQRDNVKAGESVAICASSSANYAAIFLGALRAGVSVAPLAPGSTPASLVRMIDDAGARILFTDASALALDVTPHATALRPLAPVHLSARRDGSGVTFKWIRRARFDADSWSGDIPLGEDFEQYAVDTRHFLRYGHDTQWPKGRVTNVELPPKVNGHLALYENLYAAILDGAPLLADGQSARMSLEVANAMILSSINNRTVDFPVDPAEYRVAIEQLGAPALALEGVA